MELIHLSHCVYQCDYHVVLVTKYRKKIFNEGIFAYFDKKLAEITEHYPLIRFKAVNHDRDHIHFLVSISPTMTVGTAVGTAVAPGRPRRGLRAGTASGGW